MNEGLVENTMPLGHEQPDDDGELVVAIFDLKPRKREVGSPRRLPAEGFGGHSSFPVNR